MRAPVDRNLALVQSVSPFAQRIGRQKPRSRVFAHTHSAPVHRFHVHRPERLHGAIAHVGAHAKASPTAPSQPFFSLFTALFSAQFRLIFRELACSVLASKPLEPAPKRVLAKTMLATVFADFEFTSTPCLDVKRPPLTPGFVLEVFSTHRRFSTAAENPKWNENSLSKSRAKTGRLPPTDCWQDRANCVRWRHAARSGCLHVGFRYGNGTIAFLGRLPISVSRRFCTILLGVREKFLLVP